MAGALVCLAGPSGAGKDSLMAYARERLEGNKRFHFARRVVTRGSSAHEDHESLSDAAFIRADMDGEFFLSWRAHWLAYALRADVETRVQKGETVIANLSRGVLHSPALRRLPSLIVEITAQPEILLERLMARGRESEVEVRARLAREVPAWPDDLKRETIDNSGALDAAGERLVAILKSTQA